MSVDQFGQGSYVPIWICSILTWERPTSSKKMFGSENVGIQLPIAKILSMEEILHHLGCIKPCKYWDKLLINCFDLFHQQYHGKGYEIATYTLHGLLDSDCAWSTAPFLKKMLHFSVFISPQKKDAVHDDRKFAPDGSASINLWFNSSIALSDKPIPHHFFVSNTPPFLTLPRSREPFFSGPLQPTTTF